MVAAVGNRVDSLARTAFGPVRVDGLAPGRWRWLDRDTERLLTERAPARD
jgi:16S rRNA U516 pseudouridylate synthase RsuA-like enzyme